MAENIKKPDDHGHGNEGNAGVSHERRDVNVFQVSAFGIGLLLSCIVVVFMMWAMFDFFYSREDAKNADNPAALMMKDQNKLPPEPRLQTNPREDLRELHAKEDDLLGSYGWVDRSAGVVRIPIDDAMKLMLERGLPARQESK